MADKTLQLKFQHIFNDAMEFIFDRDPQFSVKGIVKARLIGSGDSHVLLAMEINFSQLLQWKLSIGCILLFDITFDLASTWEHWI